MQPDLLNIVVSRDEVMAGNARDTLAALHRLVESPAAARSLAERVDIAFHGYDTDPRELWEIVEVRSYVFVLDRDFPYWLFFLSKHHTGLQSVLRCLLPPFLTPEAQARIFPHRIAELLARRWFPALNDLSTYAGLPPERIRDISARSERYVLGGPLPLES
jgi:hypothetical protein